MPTTKQAPPEIELDGVRNRIKELRVVPVEHLLVNPKNWRTHPYEQRKAISESLQKIGMADALLAYESPREGGRLMLIDGHARLEEKPEGEWPVLILDVTDEEADLLLLTLDPMTGMAGADAELLANLLDDTAGIGTPALEAMLHDLAMQTGAVVEEAEPEINPVPEMELQAFEHYDYVVLLYSDARDWSRAKDLLKIEDEAFTLRDGRTRKIGLGRVVDGKRLFNLVDAEE